MGTRAPAPPGPATGNPNNRLLADLDAEVLEFVRQVRQVDGHGAGRGARDVAVRGEDLETAARRVKIIAGTGANATAEALELTAQAKAMGVDGTLQVTPYYNKPTQAGLIKHFSAVADLGLPVVLYNVPGRSACEIAVATVAELARHPHVVAVKEAAGSVDRVSRLKAVCDLDVLSGDDGLTLPMMSVGACGVISVASNVAPRAVADLVHAAAAGRWDEARALHYRYYDLFNDVFIETNPIPIKAALEMAGQGPAVYRLPLCEMAPANREKLRATLQACGVVK